MTSRSPIQYATSRDGTRIAWTAMGTGPSLIFVPPWNATVESGTWRLFMSGLFDGRIVTYDRRGFGRSDWGVEHGLEQYADDLEAVADAAGMDEISLYGQAAGTWESVILAARTARIRRMLLSEPPFRSRSEGGFTAQKALFALLDSDFETFWKAWLQFSLGWGKEADVEDWTRHFVSATNPADIRAMWNVLLDADLTPFAPLVQAECLVVHNRDDPVMPPSAAADLVKLISGARLLITSGGRWSRDEATRREIRSFLEAEAIATETGAPPADLREALVAEDTPGLLSRQEAEVLRLLATGLRNREIADLLVVSERTVERHVSNVYRKLDLRGRTEATAWALRAGLV